MKIASVRIRNRHRGHRLDTQLLKRIARSLLQDLMSRQQFELDVHLVGAPEIRRLNETFLSHAGATDVIAFDYSEPLAPQTLRGEIFICLPEASLQARCFRTTWQSEVVRYLIHAVLHLCGHDDGKPRARRKMKRAEERCLRLLSRQFPLRKLGRRVSGAAGISTRDPA